MDKVKVRDQKRAERPDYHCNKCDKDFPSFLDFEEHNRLDHSMANTTAA